ncbi:MAG: O-antigen ligase family protein [Planctomycetota bacterium]
MQADTLPPSAGAGTGAHSKLEGLFTAACILFVGALALLTYDIRSDYRLAVLVGFLSLCVFAIVPNRRLLLVLAWLFVHPLSIETTFVVAPPMHKEFLPRLITLSGSDLVLFMLLIVLACEASVTKQRVWRWPPVVTPLLCLFAWAILGLLAGSAGPTPEGWLFVIQQAKLVLYIVAVSSSIRTRDEFLLVLGCLASVIALQELFVVASLARGKPIQITSPLQGSLMTFAGTETRATGTLGHPNTQAAFHTFLTLPLLGLLGCRNPRWRWFGAAVIGGSVVCIVMTSSRSAWIALAAGLFGLLLAALAHNVVRRLIWRYVTWTLPVGAVILGLFWSRIATRIIRGDEGATDSRLRAMATAMDIAGAHPLAGAGPGNFIAGSIQLHPLRQMHNEWNKPSTKPRPVRFEAFEYVEKQIHEKFYVLPLQVHNLFLLVLSELGAIGIVLFLWLQWRFFSLVRRCLRAESVVLALIAVGLYGTFWAMQFYMTLDLFSVDKPLQILYLPVILAAALDRVLDEPPADAALRTVS